MVVRRATYDALLRERDVLNGRLQAALSEIASLQQRLADMKEWEARLSADVLSYRADLARLIDRLGTPTPGQLARTLFDEDPFREQRGPDEYLSPDPEEPVDVDAIVQALDEPKPAPETVR